MRDVILKRLREDLIGPLSELEVLNARPSDVYLTGILWPLEAYMGEEEDDRLAQFGIESIEDDENSAEEDISLAGLRRPCSAGISFAMRCREDVSELNIRVCFSTYQPRTASDQNFGSDIDFDAPQRITIQKSKTEWYREPYDILVKGDLFSGSQSYVDLEPNGAPEGVRLHLRTVPASNCTLATLTLLNLSEPDEDEGRDGVEKSTLFQVAIQIQPLKQGVLVARPSRRAVLDDDDKSAALLYRNSQEYAHGHTCSATWEKEVDSDSARMVATSWIPDVTVPATSEDGHRVFQSLRQNNKTNALSVNWLATANQDDLANALLSISEAYGKWLDQKEEDVYSLPEDFREQAQRNIILCRNVKERMSENSRKITSDNTKIRAFQLANLAMNLQFSWNSKNRKAGNEFHWRPFQLGFILLAADSVAERKHPEREIMDLLWFPTGGGKTEAYLALIAYLAFYRRLSNKSNPDDGDGVAAIMRYTLRLLTTQQFIRATSVILACEAIRRGLVSDARVVDGEFGETPFSIGLWVGGGATPNKVSEAASALSGTSEQATPKQLIECPVCNEKLEWQHSEVTDSIEVRCCNSECLMYDTESPLPICTVDEDVYRTRPTLLVGTIDKFAQIARKSELNQLFSVGSNKSPDLILQDELHLISGPLGTIAGLYETAIDRLFSSIDVKPKIIGSTATIRRASDQVKSLFNRRTEQFPPSCLDADDSAFSIVRQDLSGRVYAGISTVGRSAKFTLQSVAASLIQSSSISEFDKLERDPYSTLVSYFNSLRELGGALVLMQDDVNASIAFLAKRRNEQPRYPKLIEELTSRLSQAEVRDMLGCLEISTGEQGSLDVVLATNMLSVGVDISRLGLMLVNGQPKGIAEYIQATSRVGRGNVRGLIVSVLNNAKPRDRSHFESFSTWHNTLYRDVEVTSVTPFASRARDRAIHAVLVTLVRHLIPDKLDNPELSDEDYENAKKLIDDIAKRAKEIDPLEKDVRRELEEILDIWKIRSPKYYWWDHRVDSSLLQGAERVATMRALGRSAGKAWSTLNSMRSVEAGTRFRLTEKLKQPE